MGTCYLCEKGHLKVKEVPYSLYGETIGHYSAEVCNVCGEKFFTEETSRRMTAAAKAKGLWGLEASTKIGQAGNTLDIRLPKKIIHFLNLQKGSEVTLHPEGKRKLIVEW